MDDLRSEQGQPDHSGDKRGIFPDGVGRFVGIEKSPCIDQCPPAIGAGKVRDPWVSKVKSDASKIRIWHFTKIKSAFCRNFWCYPFP